MMNVCLDVNHTTSIEEASKVKVNLYLDDALAEGTSVLGSPRLFSTSDSPFPPSAQEIGVVAPFLFTASPGGPILRNRAGHYSL